MAAKVISISADDVTYFGLPGSQGELSRDGATIDDTIFGQTYKSNLTGILTWMVSANSIYKGFAGYAAKIMKPGTSTAVTAEAMTLVSGKTYQINNVARRIWNRGATLTVKDNAVNHNADVVSIDYLFGKVTFASTYTVTGPVTVDVSYYPTIDIGRATAYTLTMTAEAIKDTDFPSASTNGGYNTNSPGLRTVALELPSVFSVSDDWQTFLINRQEIIIEVNPDGAGKSVARGFFRLMSDKQSGNVGALEVENLNFSLNVPYSSSGIQVAIPFGWSHAVDSQIPAGIKVVLDSFLNETKPFVKYLPLGGPDGVKGRCVVTGTTLTGGMETPNSFAITLTGDGGLTVLP